MLAREVFQSLPILATIIPPLAFSCAIKVHARKQAIRENPKLAGQALEVHHIKARRDGGSEQRANAVALSRDQHAGVHWKIATAQDTPTPQAKAHFWAVSKIVQRMTPDELSTFNRLVHRR